MSILFLFLFREKKKDISFIYLLSIYHWFYLWIKSKDFVLGFPEAPGSFLPTKWTRSPFRMLFWSGSGVLAKRIRCCSPSLCLFSLCPLGRAAAGAGGLREDSLRSFFFQCNTGKKNLFLQLSRFCIFRMDLQIMFEAYVMTHPPISFYLNKAGKSQVQIRECFSQPLKERLDEGRGMRRGEENAFGDREILFVFHQKRRRPRMVYGACYLKGFFDRGGIRTLSSFRPLAYWDSSLRALPAPSN